MPKLSNTRITKRLVDTIPPSSTIWDSEVRGFGLRCQVNERIYVLKCTIKKQRHFVTIGKHGSPWTVESARAEARRIQYALHRGENSSATQIVTVADLCDRYSKEYAPRKKPSSRKSDAGLIENHVRPLLGRKSVRTVTRRDIEDLHNAIHRGKTAPLDPKAKQMQQRGGQPVRGGPGVANRCLTLLSKLFNLAEEWGIRPDNSNPVRHVKHFPEKGRERFLRPDEIGRLGAVLAASEENTFALAAIRLLILTGARLGEILTLRWEWVDLERGLLQLPDSKTGKKVVHLSQPAIAIFRSLPRLTNNQHVIVGARTGGRLVNLQKPWKRICNAAALTEVRLHDLRHTFASFAVGGGLSLPIIGALLSHGSTQTTERYAHFQRDQIHEAGELVGETLGALLSGGVRS